jgi:hypothetical protein
MLCGASARILSIAILFRLLLTSHITSPHTVQVVNRLGWSFAEAT